MKVIKAESCFGQMLQEYGADITDNFASGTRAECLEAIKRDIFDDLDQDVELILLDDAPVRKDEEGHFTGYEKSDVEEYLTNLPEKQDRIVARVLVKDNHASVYESTYRLVKDQADGRIYKLTLRCFYQDWKKHPNPQITEIRRPSLKECWAAYEDMAIHHDMAIYTPYTVVGIAEEPAA